MNGIKITHSMTILVRILLGILIAVTLLSEPLHAAESGDAQLFIAGFNAYQKEEYGVTVQKLSRILKEYPASPLRDMTLFWLARATYRTGDRPEAARVMSQFLKEYPDHPLKGTVEEELLKLAAQYDQGTAIAKTKVEPPVAKTDEAKVVPSVTSSAAVTPPAVLSATTPPPATKPLPSTTQTVIATDIPVTPKLPTVKRPRHSRQQEQKTALRNKAIADYRATMDRYPGTPAAAEAADRLSKLGIPTHTQVASEKTAPPPRAPVTPPRLVAPSPVPSTSTGIAAPGEAGSSQVVTLEIEQYADLGLTVTLPAFHPESGSRLSIPLEVSNQGNGSDSFSLESGFPADYAPRFSTATAPDVPLTATPNLAPGETWRGIFSLALPSGDVDGRKLRYPVRTTSRFSRNVSRTSEVLLTVSAPLLRGLMKPDSMAVLPGETVSYRITLLNIGSAPARSVRFRLEYPAALDPVTLTGFRQETGSVVMDNFSLTSGESREITVTFKLKAATPALQDLICRGELVNPALQTRETFVSTAATVQPVYNVTLTALQDRLFSLPGQTVTVPLIVTNTGNIREPVLLTTDAPEGYRAVIYNDSNRNGVRTPGEPVLKRTAALAPNEAIHLLLEISVPADAKDSSEATVMITAAPASGEAGKTEANIRVTLARPLVELAASSKAGRLKPGEVASVEVVCLNRGSSLARSVTVQSVLPPQLELVVTEPMAATSPAGELTWTIPELGAGEKRTMRLIYRVKSGVTAGASLAVSNRVTYEDHLGNRY